ncbi:hypothetical protein [Glycomyces buryatensis]|uniref:Uncharacterized protein n=1 Tax=Glycomyces buryatensis TaxID=2570927 RepID=A0A4S8QBG2_9ACTN|nr:hypothetical protein [Glycomyces buryatensis]THV41873.1 hypothetical protein FAB82_09130 [Glycomyces buryatensis]
MTYTPHPPPLPPGSHHLSERDQALLRDPRHPIHHGLQLHPVPNLIFTRTGKPSIWESRLRVSWWGWKTVIWAQFSRAQKVLLITGIFSVPTFCVLGGVIASLVAIFL